MARRKSTQAGAASSVPAATALNLPAATQGRGLPLGAQYAGMAVLAFAVYANSLGNGFITDDQFQILNNPIVTGAQSLGSAFGSGVWAFLGYRGNYYRPLQFVIYGALYRAFGATALPFHVLMALLHAGNAVLAFSLARRVLAKRLQGAAWVAGAIFAVHPIHTEAVNWIAALPDVLVTTFALTGMRAFVAQEAAPNTLQTAAHCAIYLAALLSKETGVMLLPLYAAWQWLRAGRRGALRNGVLYAGMLGVLAAYLAMRVHALGGLAPAQQTFFHLDAAEFAINAVILAARHLMALVWPVGLNFFYVFHPVKGASGALLLALLTLAGVAWAAVWFRRRNPIVTFALFWIVLTIAPALNITGVGQNVFAERYLYLPSMGFALLAALAWSYLLRARPDWASPAAGAILLLFSMETIARNRVWKDDFTLLETTLRQSPDSGYLHNLMAGAWVQRDQFPRALEEQKLAVYYEPKSAVFHKNLGNILLEMDPAAAAREFTSALAIQPDSAELHRDLGLAYRAMGEAGKAADEFARATGKSTRPN